MLLAFAIGLGLAAAPPLFGGHPAAWWEWLGAIAGAVVGWRVGFRRQDSGFREDLYDRGRDRRAVPLNPAS
jgi:hypothetical protein